jgi:hypothetical protein
VKKDLDVAYREPTSNGGGNGGGGGDSGGGGDGGNDDVRPPTPEDLAQRWETFNQFVAEKKADGWQYDEDKEALVLGTVPPFTLHS